MISTGGSQKALEKHISQIRGFAIYDTLVAVLYVALVAYGGKYLVSWGTTGFIVIAMAVSIVCLWLVEIVISCVVVSIADAGPDGASMRAECVDKLVNQMRYSIAISCVGICIYLVRYFLELWQLRERGELYGYALWTGIGFLFVVLVRRLIRIVEFLSFIGWLRSQAGTASTSSASSAWSASSGA